MPNPPLIEMRQNRRIRTRRQDTVATTEKAGPLRDRPALPENRAAGYLPTSIIVACTVASSYVILTSAPAAIAERSILSTAT